MGRPREFDVERALDQALEVFWRNGYEGASIADLTQAMGVNPPSLYAAFGNKEKLFRKALERYIGTRTNFWNEAAQLPTARAMIERLFDGTVEFLSDECTPKGCLLVRGTMSCSEAADKIAHELTAKRAEGEALLRERLEGDRAKGLLPDGLDPADFARYVMTVLEGMSVRAAGGASRTELRKIADMALRSWG